MNKINCKVSSKYPDFPFLLLRKKKKYAVYSSHQILTYINPNWKNLPKPLTDKTYLSLEQ